MLSPGAMGELYLSGAMLRCQINLSPDDSAPIRPMVPQGHRTVLLLRQLESWECVFKGPRWPPPGRQAGMRTCGLSLSDWGV
jgi:hypothetical protein